MDEPKKTTKSQKKKYRDSVVNFRRGVHKAKYIWVQRLMATFEKNMDDGKGHDNPWDIVKELRKRLSKVKKSEKVMMQMSEGIYAKTSAENLQVFKKHLEKLLGRVPNVDESVLGLVDQLHVWEELEAEPPIVEIDDAIRKLNFTAAGHDGITAGMWKALARDDEIFFDWMVQYVRNFWKDERLPDGWELVDCTMLPKKGDLKLPKN